MPVRLIITSDYQRNLFGRDPLWRGWAEGSLSRALSYIEAWRDELGEGRLVLFNVGTAVQDVYTLYPRDVIARVSAYAGYADTTDLLTTAELERIAAKLDPDGRTIGVVDFTAPGVYEARAVDITGFPVEAAYEEYFKPLIDSMQAWYDTPLVRLTDPAPQSGFLFGETAYTAMFHQFQLETTGADVSFFAVPRIEAGIPAGELTFGDLLRRFRYANELVTLELTGEEIRRYLEYAYGLRYNTMRASTDDLLRLTRDRDGTLRTRSAVYNLDEAAGIRYEVDVTRPVGRRIRILAIDYEGDQPFEPNATYRVAVNSHRLTSGYLARATGLSAEQIDGRLLQILGPDTRLLLREWLEKQHQGLFMPVRVRVGNWRVLPESFADPAREREGALF
jgi:2',3'-cyclic-nucleotide 2'-phosphodiesterase/3'-nucleotidase